MTDFHAHILPGVDHGCTDGDMARRQLQLARKAGVNTIAVTPHFYPHLDKLQEYLLRRDRAFAELQKINSGRLQLLLGAEVLLCNGLDHMEGLKSLCIGQSKVILLEMPFSPWTRDLLETVQRLQDIPDLITVLAHVDRYPPEAIAELRSMGLCGQVNAEAFCRISGKKRLLEWIDEGFIRAIGSDIHGTDVGYREYEKAARYLGAERMNRLMSRMIRLLEMKSAN